MIELGLRSREIELRLPLVLPPLSAVPGNFSITMVLRNSASIKQLRQIYLCISPVRLGAPGGLFYTQINRLATKERVSVFPLLHIVQVYLGKAIMINDFSRLDRLATVLDFTGVKLVHFMHESKNQYFRETVFYFSLTKIYTVKLI